MRGLASRVQPTDRPWNTFSIRYSRRNGSETEYAKRMQAIRERERGWLLPALTVQAYVTKDRAQLLSACVVGTVSLFEFLQEQMTHAGDCCVELKTTGSDGARFLAVKWSALRAAGIKILTWPTAGASRMNHSPPAIAFAPPSAMRLALHGRQVRASAFGVGER